MTCSNCGEQLLSNERFCAGCGTAVPAPSPSGGVSRLELEPELVNTLLDLYASKPEGPKLQLLDGRLQILMGDHCVDLNPVCLEQAAQVALKAGPLGNLNLSIDRIQLGQRGLELQVRLNKP
jgi:hypothetical protein